MADVADNTRAVDQELDQKKQKGSLIIMFFKRISLQMFSLNTVGARSFTCGLKVLHGNIRRNEFAFLVFLVIENMGMDPDQLKKGVIINLK